MVLLKLETPGTAELDHAVADLRRVSRTIKGGRRFRFRAAVLVGNRQGLVGFGIGKGADVAGAIAKGQTAAKKRLYTVPRYNGTIPHAQEASFRGAVVLLKPAPAGTGIIAGGPLRALASLAGIRDLSAKIRGSHNSVSVARAALRAFVLMKTTRGGRGSA